MIKKILLIFLLMFFPVSVFSVTPGLYLDTSIYKVDAERNAYLHNNRGLLYMQEGFYFGAIKEFKLAIDLNPNTQATGVYYSNLGKVYLKIGYPSLAQVCFERAVEQNPMDFGSYENLVVCYKRQGLLNKKLQSYKKSDNPLAKIMIGVLMVETGQRRDGLTLLDNFCVEEPDLIITNAVKNYIEANSR